jgi:hypothetical protein
MVPVSRTGFLIIIGIALAVRLGAMVALDGPGRATLTSHDEHPTIARHLVRGDGFRFNFFGPLDRPPVRTSQQAPLVPMLLAGCHLMFGLETRASWGAMLLLQIVASSWTAGLMADIGVRVSGSSRLGWLAGLATAVYPPLVLAPLHVQALVWNLLWLTLALDGWSRWMEPSGDRSADGSRIGAGLLRFSAATALGMLTDPILGAPALAMLAFWVLAPRAGAPFTRGNAPPNVAGTDERRSTGPVGQTALGARWAEFRRRCLSGLIAGLAILLALAPWTARNAVVHGRFVLVKDSFWYVFWQGNNAVSVGTDKLPVAGSEALSLVDRWNPFAADAAAFASRARSESVNVTLTPADVEALFARPTEIERMDWFRDRIRAELAEDPGRYWRLCWRRLGMWVGFDDTNPRSFLPLYRLGWFALAAMSVVGAGFAAGRAAWLAILAPALALTAVHVLVITSARFRIPLELLLLLPAAGFVEGLLRRWFPWADRGSSPRF